MEDFFSNIKEVKYPYKTEQPKGMNKKIIKETVMTVPVTESRRIWGNSTGSGSRVRTNFVLPILNTKNPKSKTTFNTYTNAVISVSGISNTDTGPDMIIIRDESNRIIFGPQLIPVGTGAVTFIGNATFNSTTPSKLIVTVYNPAVRTQGAGAFDVQIQITGTTRTTKKEKF